MMEMKNIMKKMNNKKIQGANIEEINHVIFIIIIIIIIIRENLIKIRK